MKIDKSEFLKDPFIIAREILLGATLYSRIRGQLTAGRIVEIELYMGDCDRACHAYPNKKTPRTAVMFKAGGRAYAHLIHGIHTMLNVVISGRNQPNGILIRALEPLEGIDIMAKRRGLDDVISLCNGPGKLTQALGITVKHNGIDLCGDKIWLEAPATPIASDMIIIGPRIGIDYAGPDVDLPWRFTIKESEFISAKIGKKK